MWRGRNVSLDDAELRSDCDPLRVAARSDELLALDEALERLATIDPRAARVVECRFFGGLSEAETAEALGVSRRTVAGDWMVPAAAAVAVRAEAQVAHRARPS